MAREPGHELRGFGDHIYDLDAPLDDVEVNLDLGGKTEAA
ncbi:hypothetical protein GCM10010404_58490 [Nonomuraea africana]|uniref:Uncharacterized protein n=1 Tax=Nonomuraea africana TaxID=46171 RepID=A0ABR9KAE5_9ACTN|nr:hypothetical protein [Nonomuraea africana]